MMIFCGFLTRFLSGGVSKNLKLWNIQNTDSDDTTVMLHDELEFDAAIVSCVMDEQMNLGNKASNQIAHLPMSSFCCAKFNVR